MSLSPNLTKREIEILKYIAAEYNTREISQRIFISPHTVMSHRKNIQRKMGVKNVAGMIYQACRIGILDFHKTNQLIQLEV